MKTSRRFELGSVLGLVTLYVGMAHVAASEKMANALLAAGDHVSIGLLIYVVALVVLRFVVVVVVPGVVTARLGLLAWEWAREVGGRRAKTRSSTG
jgi:cytochrome b561